jgi:ABC-type glycerol-3-phosphate transport system permease component
MPIVPQVGRRSFKVRLVLIAMYALLTIGGVTMVVPFLITLTGSFANRYDYYRFQLWPRFLFDDDALRMKVLFERYADNYFPLWASHYRLKTWTRFEDAADAPDPMADEDLKQIAGDAPTPAQQRQIDDYDAFLEQFDPAEIVLGAGRAYKDTYPVFLKRRYHERLLESHPEAASWPPERQDEQARLLLIRTHGLRVYENWAKIPAMPNIAPRDMRRWYPEPRGEFPDWLAYVQSTPLDWRLPITANYVWHRWLTGRYGTIDQLNQAWGTEHESFYRIRFDWRGPTEGVPAAMWRAFIVEAMPIRWIELPPRYEDAWRAFAQKQFVSIEMLNKATGASLKTWDDLPRVECAPVDAMLRQAWVDFLDEHVPPDDRILRTPERDYAGFLERRYESLTALNDAYGADFAAFADVPMPIALAEEAQFLKTKSTWRWRFLTDNYRIVLQYIISKGRALWTTTVLVVLALFTALTVNPLAAYALSRFQLKSTHRILLFLLATMAFPAEVAMIPTFLLLRDFNLLNTFAALVLPGMANGFAVFLLKGFFDSLPIELYEAADIDGASEIRKFVSITMPLAAPILAVIALQAFLAAYGGFIWAFLVCQDERMWTLMVWLYQFQSKYSRYPWLVMASIVVASIPTLLVYLFCQRIILRGIILPTMK